MRLRTTAPPTFRVMANAILGGSWAAVSPPAAATQARVTGPRLTRRADRREAKVARSRTGKVAGRFRRTACGDPCGGGLKESPFPRASTCGGETRADWPASCCWAGTGASPMASSTLSGSRPPLSAARAWGPPATRASPRLVPQRTRAFQGVRGPETHERGQLYYHHERGAPKPRRFTVVRKMPTRGGPPLYRASVASYRLLHARGPALGLGLYFPGPLLLGSAAHVQVSVFIHRCG